MIRQENIKKLIQKGFDLDLISFELNIPIDQLELQREKSKPKENKNPYLKISKMREKYKALYFSENTLGEENARHVKISEQDIEAIRTIIATVEEKIQEMKGRSIKEKRGILYSILAEIKNIEKYPAIPLEEVEKLYLLMCSEEVERPCGKSTRDTLLLQVKKKKRL